MQYYLGRKKLSESLETQTDNSYWKNDSPSNFTMPINHFNQDKHAKDLVQ